MSEKIKVEVLKSMQPFVPDFQKKKEKPEKKIRTRKRAAKLNDGYVYLKDPY